MSHFLPHVTVIDPQSPYNKEVVNIRLEKGRIVELGKSTQKKEGDFVIERENTHMAPSWVDIGTQSGEPGFEHRETWASLSKAAHTGGYGHLLIQPNTAPPLDQAAAVRGVTQIRSAERVQFHPMGLASINTRGENLTEWLDLADAGAAAFTDGPHALRSNAFMLKALRYSHRVGKRLIHAPHDAAFIPGAMVHESQQSVEMGLRAWPPASETLLMDRDLNLMQYTGASLVWHNLSSADAIDRLKCAKHKMNVEVAAGVAYLNLCYTEKEVAGFNTSFKVSPPLRAESDRLALWKALEEGCIDYVASNHVPLEEDRKKTTFPQAGFGAEGLESVMSAFLAACPLKDPLQTWVKLVAIGPRSLLNWTPVTLKKGQLADFTLFNPNPKRSFNREEIQSRSKNNPNIGRQMKGEILGRLQGTHWLPISEK